MAYNWKLLKIPRFYGVDLKTNLVDVGDGFSLGASNVFGNQKGVVSKRKGNSVMFAADETGAVAIDEIGTCVLGVTKYWFKFSGGTFSHASSLTGAVTTLSPAPAISTTLPIWYAAVDDKLFFVDGTNVLRYFDGTAIFDATVYQRPTVAPTTASGGTGYSFSYTVEKVQGGAGTGESPIRALLSTDGLLNIGSGATVRVAINTGPQSLVAGDRLRIYRQPFNVASAWKNVTNTGTFYYVITAGDVTATFVDIVTLNSVEPATIDALPNMYSDLGIALNKTAPTALQGINVHYGRLVGWKNDTLYVSKSSSPLSWPDDAAPKQAFVYSVGIGDGEDITRCISYREALIVFKSSTYFALPGIGPDDTGGNAFAFRRIESNGIGCVAGKSAVVIGDDGDQYLVFLAKQGFFSTTGDKPIRIGENIETLIFPYSQSLLSVSVGFYHKKEGFYACSVGSDASKAIFTLDVRKDKEKLTGWFPWASLNARCAMYDVDQYIFGTAQGLCLAERNSNTSLDFADVRQEYVAAASINTGTDELTVTQSYQTGDAVVLRTTGTVPAGLVVNTTYFAIRVSATVIKLASSLANAIALIALDITTQGVGTHSLISSQAISAEYTTNWIKFDTSTHIKKIGRPALLINAQATSVNLTVTTAFDWVASFGDPIVASVGSSDAWGTLPWGTFVWGNGATASNRNLAVARRKLRSIRFKIANATINQDFDCQGLELPFDVIRNRGNYI